tara:strand:+ start:1065 stop:4241 length:3177 start_codon:yes stop_codon:yes gene_type:complete
MNDQTFITNQDGVTLKKRFSALIKDTRLFDALVGYFYTSGFKAIYPSLKVTEKIRILIGISTNYETFKAIQSTRMSHKEVCDKYSEIVQDELENSEDSLDTEESIRIFKDWLSSGKIELRAYPNEKIHSKVYIMTFNEGDRDLGRVITGSSNFTESGLNGNIEFNVELKSPSDYEYALQRFEELWVDGIDLSNQYVETIDKDTWLNDDVTPYELYLKFLYEYFKEEINQDEDLTESYRPDNFKYLKYQEHAVINAKRIVNEYGGVFISDVVGLGKTYMGTMLCQELGGSTLVIAPPHLIDENNPGSWENAFADFGFRSKDYKCLSKGIIEQIASKKIYERFDTILIDEAHYYRNEDTSSFTYLYEICKNKKVILVTATPFNNRHKDLFPLIKLFQPTRNSDIPNLSNIENFFSQLASNLKRVNKKEQPDEYLEVFKNNAKLIRERLLKYIMVRRTRQEVQEFYGKDLEGQGMKFPQALDPKPIYYQFDDKENITFDDTLHILTEIFTFARYRPLDYLTDQKKLKTIDKISQKNITKFMKILLVKRLESSSFAFKKTIGRLIESYKNFIEQYESGTIYISKKNIKKILDFLEIGDDESISAIIEQGDAEKYPIEDFEDSFIEDLNKDLENLIYIKNNWDKIKIDSKLEKFKDLLSKDSIFKKNKFIIFTESKDSSFYLANQLSGFFNNRVLQFSGGSPKEQRKIVIKNFDNNAEYLEDKYDVLITTDVLAEGVNLHRCNIVINYDIPWNPTKIMQRVGRINRVDTPHDFLHTYNFFPTEKAENEIGLKENATSKIGAFISLLGVDAKLLTDDEEVEAHSLFDQLNSKTAIEGEEIEQISEIGFLQEIREVRDDNIDLFEKIKKLPKKCRSSRELSSIKGLLTFVRRGRLKKFFFASSDNKSSTEKDFVQSAIMMKTDMKEKKGKFGKNYYQLLELNKSSLNQSLDQLQEEAGKQTRGGGNLSSLRKLLSSKEIKNFKGYTDIQEEYLSRVIKEIDNGSLSKGKAKIILESIKKVELIKNPIKLINRLSSLLPEGRLTKVKILNTDKQGKKEVILSEYFS